MTDLISRSDAIAYIDRVINSGLGRNKSLDYIRKYISALPSAEIPTESTNTPTNTPTDLISREDALQCKPEFLNPNPNDKPNNYPIGWNDAIKVWYADIKSLPSADALLKQEIDFHKEVSRIEAEKVVDLEHKFADAVKVAYICDGRKCDKDCSECFRTLDIEHARDFKRMGDTYYQQESADTVPIEKYHELQHQFVMLGATFTDLTEVVRCKDCQHRFYDKYNDCFMCDRHEYGESFEDDDFCSWGERREK